MGATKNDAGKLRYDLIPPEALRELARVYTIGARKYGDDNWKKGLSKERLLAALMRHLEKYRAGHRFDQEDGQEHMSSVAWCAFALLWQDARSAEVLPTETLCGVEGCSNPDHQLDPGPPVRWER